MKRNKKNVHLPLPWYIGTCNQGKKCWCRTITSKKGSDEMEDCVVPSGAMRKADAEFVVSVVNEWYYRNGGK
jgi:hypothetical protein